MIIDFTLSVGGVPTDPQEVTASDPTGSYGVRRADTGAIVVSNGTAFTRASAGVYSLDVPEPAPGLTYEYWVEWKYGGETYRVNGRKTASISAGISLFSAFYRRLVANPNVSAIASNAIWHNIAKDGEFPNLVIDIDRNEDAAISERPAKHYDVTVHCNALSEDQRDALLAAVVSALDRQTWADGNVSIASISLTNSSVSADAESGNAEQEYFSADPTFHVIAGV